MKNVVYLLVILAFVLAACGDSTDESTPAPGTDAAASNDAPTYAGKKIVWLDSYHEGYEWSDGIQSGIASVLAGTQAELLIVRMDTKHVLDEEGRQATAEQVRAEIDAFAPDVIIASDDDAQQYVIVPFYKDTATPVVFAGVNHDAKPYGYPTDNVTGMLEVDLIKQVVEQLRPFADGDRIALLSDDNTTSHRIAKVYAANFPRLQTPVFTNSYEEFKQAYVSLQQNADLLLIYNNSGIVDWDEADARAFFLDNLRIPTGGVLDWMNPYLTLTIAHVPSEQGVWAASTALRILDGTPISGIPVTQNEEGVIYANLDMANKLDMALPPALLRNAIAVSASAPAN